MAVFFKQLLSSLLLPLTPSIAASDNGHPFPLVWLESAQVQAYDSSRKNQPQTMAFQVGAREIGRVVVVDVVGRMTLSDGRTRLRDLIHVFTGNGCKKFLINLAGVDFVDSDGLGELTRCYSIVRQIGGQMKLVHVHQRVQALLELTRIVNLFEIHSTEQTALQTFR